MNDELVRSINAVVRPDDVLYHLGDFNFGGLKNQWEFRRRVNCDTVHLIHGNHDFNHGSFDPASVNHGFASVSHYKEIVVDRQPIVLSHYAFRVWNNQAKGAWHLYGHSHGLLRDLNNFSMDVGVDYRRKAGLANPYQPWELNELRAFMAFDTVDPLDGHTKEDLNAPFKQH